MHAGLRAAGRRPRDHGRPGQPALPWGALLQRRGGWLRGRAVVALRVRSEEHTSELQSLAYLVCRLLLEKKKKNQNAVLLYVISSVLMNDHDQLLSHLSSCSIS